MLTIISHQACYKHDMGPMHPESPARLATIDVALKSSNLQYVSAEAPRATKEQLAYAHDPKYIDYIFAQADNNLHMIDPDTIMMPFTLEAALRAAGSGIYAVDLLTQNKANAAFCKIRPPGHHAEVDKAMGFCFFNNIAIAAMYALKKYNLQKILIVDFDVHHGNGTQSIIKDDPRIMFCSSYQYPYYPGRFTQEGGNIHHIRLNAGDGTHEFRNRVREWFPAIKQFKPQLLLFSAGFDAHRFDPLAQINLDSEDYYWITSEVIKNIEWIDDPKIISFLEGGYNLDYLGEAVVKHLEAISSVA